MILCLMGNATNRIWVVTLVICQRWACSPSLANIFLIDFDFQAQNGFRIKPKWFFRFLDDLFFLFRGTLQELLEYQTFLNSLVPNISLTFNYNTSSVDFLDITVFKFVSRSHYTLQTRVHFKETDSHSLLH